ncbi:RNA-directed DNA polymerase, eukaryota, reverse transcriptase zinc-binding domain protein [Tanacetum coccineum]
MDYIERINNYTQVLELVSWKYLDFVLHNLGFGNKWRSWIRACLHSSRASILVNGSPTLEFSIKRVSSNLIHGINLVSPDLTLSHLFTLSTLLSLPNGIHALSVGARQRLPNIDRIENEQWSWNWSRNDIGVRNTAYFRDLLIEIKARRVIDDKILPSLAISTSWDKTLPRKVNIFMWRLMLDRLPHRLNLSSRCIDIQSISCPFCNGNVESSNHIVFECDIALEVWRLVRIWCDITSPTFTSLEHWKNWTGLWQTSKEKKASFLCYLRFVSLMALEIS